MNFYNKYKYSILAIYIAIILFFVTGCTREKDRLDTEVRRLCEIDGGITVYETVELPPEEFDEWGIIKFYEPTKDRGALGTDYYFEKETQYYVKGNPEMWRAEYKIIRKDNDKLLSKSISYSRRGGDLPGPWHESSFGCPRERGDIPLIKRTFIPDSK